VSVNDRFYQKGGVAMPTTNRRVLTIKEAAKLIDGLTEYRIRQMCISGQLPCFMAGKKYLIAEENLYKAVFGENYRRECDVA
jgi:excisionase family DNA binding protein